MEHRLVYFAVGTEQQENTAEVPQNEAGPDKDLKDAGAELAQLENLKAKPGGTKAATEARELMSKPQTSDFVKELLQKKITAVEAAAAARKNELTKESTATLDKAVADLKKSVEFQKNRLADNASADSEFGRLASLNNAKELFENAKVSVESKSKGGSVELTFAKFNSLEGFRKLGLDQKKALLKAMNEQLLGNGPESQNAAESLRDSFLSNSEVPKSWKEWLKNPEKGFSGAGEKEKTLGYVVDWVNKNLGPLVIQSEKFKSIASQADANPQAAKQLSEKGVKTSLENFRELSRTERNEVLSNYANVLAGADADLAKRAAEAGVSDVAESGSIQTENTAAIEKAEAETTAQAEDLTPKLQKIALDQKLSEKAAARQRELEAAGKKETDTADKVANLRAQAADGESVSFTDKLKNFFGQGKKPEAANDHTEGPGTENSEEPKNPEDFAALARRQVAREVFEGQKGDDASKALGLKSLPKEDAAQLSSLLALEKIDVESVRGQLSPEVKSILARQAADDHDEKIA